MMKMKKFLFGVLFVMLAAFFVIGAIGTAESAMLKIEFEYDPGSVYTMTAIGADGVAETEHSAPYNSSALVTGFRVYKNGSVLCETKDPAARLIECDDPDAVAKILDVKK